MKKNKNFLLIVSSLFFILFLLEIIFQLTLPRLYEYKYHKVIYRLWDQGKIFKNIDNFFKYAPNSSIKHEVFFDINNQFLKEYSYEIKTNNFGLVQDNDIQTSIPSILFLGDSFTEGMGAPSWINYFEGKINKYQVINGGIFGTGPQQFEALEKHIDEFYDIEKVIILYIGTDIIRDPFNFSDQNLKCLENNKFCRGPESFYGFPLKEKNPTIFLKKLKQYRDDQNEKFNWKQIRRKIKYYISSLYVVRIPREFLQNNFYKSKNEKIIKNFNSIRNLIKKYNEKIIFIQIQTIDEIQNQKKNYYSIYSENFIKTLTDKHFHCGFENNPNLFYKYDGHPNRKGYRRLYKCVAEIIDKLNFGN